MNLRFILLMFFSFGMLSCASQPKEEVRSQRVIYGVVQQPSAEGGMFVLCANCRTVTPKTPIVRPGPISFVPPPPLHSSQKLSEKPIIETIVDNKPIEFASRSNVATEPVKLKIDAKEVSADEALSKSKDLNKEVQINVIKEAEVLTEKETEIKETNEVVKDADKTTKGLDIPNKGSGIKEEKKTVVYFNGVSVRPERSSVSILDQISVDARSVDQIALRARMAQTGSLQERISLARARSVEIRQELINRGVSAKKLRAYYHANCCWIGDPANPNNNRVEVMLEPTKS